MKGQLSPRDLEVLSAYLDGQLKPQDLAQLETRLLKEPELKAELTALERTRMLIQAVPRLRAPRNFTLTPEMVGIRRPVGATLYPTFRLASAIASLLFVAVVVSDFVGGGIWYPAAGDQAAPQVAVLQEKESAPREEIASAPGAEAPAPLAQEIPAEMIQEPAEPETYAIETEVAVEGEGEPKDLISGVPSTITPEMEEAAEAAAEAFKVPEEGAVPEEEPAVMMEAPVVEGEIVVSEDQPQMERSMEVPPEAEMVEEMESEATPEPAQEIGEAISLKAEPVEEMVQDTALVSIEEDEEIQPPEVETRVEAPDERIESAVPGLSLLRIAEVVLGIIALVMGGLAFYFRRRF